MLFRTWIRRGGGHRSRTMTTITGLLVIDAGEEVWTTTKVVGELFEYPPKGRHTVYTVQATLVRHTIARCGHDAITSTRFQKPKHSLRIDGTTDGLFEDTFEHGDYGASVQMLHAFNFPRIEILTAVAIRIDEYFDVIVGRVFLLPGSSVSTCGIFVCGGWCGGRRWGGGYRWWVWVDDVRTSRTTARFT
jgi:hypothetical protein